LVDGDLQTKLFNPRCQSFHWEEGKYSILELADWFHRKELVVNTEYQRGAGLWPTPAKGYFIDTVLKGVAFRIVCRSISELFVVFGAVA